MSCLELLKRFLFIHARQIGNNRDRKKFLPTGRPLYAYRCTDKAYQDLRMLIGREFRKALSRNVSVGYEACFCLYAAETFRREHDGGTWTWKTVFSPLMVEIPENSIIVGWVEKGLEYWGREMLQSPSERRLALATVVCEGGLPLRLLQREGASLRLYFQRVLHAYHGYSSYSQDIEGLARTQIYALPQSLRNEEVARLAAALIKRTVELQQQIGDATDPIVALDEKVTDWRLSLPLRMDDKTAEALFKNLVEESRAIASAIAVRPSWLGALEEKAPCRFAVSKVLQFPITLKKDDLTAMLGGDPKPRTRLLFNTRYRSEPIAVLTESHMRRDNEPQYRFEWLRRGGLVLTGSAVVEPHAIVLNDGQREAAVELKHGEAWGESPWVFLPTRHENKWRWFSEGSASLRANEAIVVIPKDFNVDLSEDGRCERLGDLFELDREVFKISGYVDFLTPEGDRYRVRCNAASDTSNTLKLLGMQLYEALNQSPVYLGVPKFYEYETKGTSRIATGRLQWRSLGSAEVWASDTSYCVGRVWLRLLDLDSGVELIRRLVDVVPKNTKVKRDIGNYPEAGRYELDANGLIGVSIVRYQEVPRVTLNAEGSGFAVNCLSIQSIALEPLHLKLEWPKGRSVTLVLPYPQKGAMLQLDGRTLLADELVTLNRLYGLWVIVQNPSGRERFFVDADLVGGTSDIGQLGAREKLPYLQNGELQLNLGFWVDRIKHLLAAKDDPNAAVRLSVHSRNGQYLARILVARYDVEIHPIHSSNSVYLPVEYFEKLGEGWSSRVSLEMLPLWSPTVPSKPLAMCEDVTGQWPIPLGLPSGPWWVIGRDGDWARFRPLLWTVAGEAILTSEQAAILRLDHAIREPDSELRARRIDDVLDEMGRSPVHLDWELLQSYIALTIDFSPNTLDVLRHLIRHPQTLAMASLIADDSRFLQLISFADQMPFSWNLMPVEDWHQAALAYFNNLLDSLATVETGEEICYSIFEQFRERAKAAFPYFESLCDWLQERVFPNRRLSNSGLQAVRKQPNLATLQIEMEMRLLQGRHDADEDWPAWQRINCLADAGLLSDELRFAKITSFQRPVRCAPFVAAAIALGDRDQHPPTPELVYQLRVIRAFDTEWFDHAYGLGLTLGLSRDNWEGCL